jgi:hypothetical protein
VPIYQVISKATGDEVYRYDAPGPIEWTGMEFATHAHAEVIADSAQPVVTLYGGRRALSKIEFRRLFPGTKVALVDEFNALFESNPLLTDEQKRDIRSGIEDYRATDTVNLDDVSTQKMIGLYTLLGLITPEEASGVLNG